MFMSRSLIVRELLAVAMLIRCSRGGPTTTIGSLAKCESARFRISFAEVISMAKKATLSTTASITDAQQSITKKIKDLGDWRGDTLARVRELIHDADPDVQEEWKWMGTPVWAHDGIICTGESYKEIVKLTFARGASLSDPTQLFNSSLEGNTRRAIDIHEGEKINAVAFKKLIRFAVAANSAARAKRASSSK